VHLVGFTIELYYDARTYKRQMYTDVSGLSQRRPGFDPVHSLMLLDTHISCIVSQIVASC
jgi:hypothetical protein